MIKEYLKKDEIAKNGSIIFVFTLMAGFLNYVYQIYMGRTLGPEEYGTFGVLFSISYLMAIISQTLSTSTTRFVSHYTSENKKIGFFIIKVTKNLTIIGFIFSIIFILLRNQIADIFQLSNSSPIVILGIIIFFTMISPIYDGTLRGLKKFSLLGFSGVINALFKLIFGILLVILGFGVNGALFGVVIGIGISLIISFIFVLPQIQKNNPHDPPFDIKNYYYYSFPVLFAMMGLTMPGNIDLIIVKHFFTPLDAGIYASITILGKIILFISGAIGTVMFPLVVNRKNSKIILKKSLLYVLLLSGSLLLIYLLFPGIVIKIFGERYSGGENLIKVYGLAMLCFSLINIMVNYYLAIKYYRYILMFVFFTIIEIISLIIFHNSMLEIVDVLFVANILFLAISMVYTFKSFKNIDLKNESKSKLDVFKRIG